MTQAPHSKRRQPAQALGDSRNCPTCHFRCWGRSGRTLADGVAGCFAPRRSSRGLGDRLRSGRLTAPVGWREWVDSYLSDLGAMTDRSGIRCPATLGRQLSCFAFANTLEAADNGHFAQDLAQLALYRSGIDPIHQVPIVVRKSLYLVTARRPQGTVCTNPTCAAELRRSPGNQSVATSSVQQPEQRELASGSNG